MSGSIKVCNKLFFINLSMCDPGRVVVSCLIPVIIESITDETGNQTIATISCVCKELNLVVKKILWSRMIVLHVHRDYFNPFRITDMKTLRQSLFKEISDTIKQVVSNTKVSTSDQDTHLFRLENSGDLVGQVTVACVRLFWLEVEVYSVGSRRFVKEWTCVYFPTIDTRGFYLAVDNGVDPVARVRLPTCMHALRQQIRAVIRARPDSSV